jgi:hypothetical protein
MIAVPDESAGRKLLPHVRELGFTASLSHDHESDAWTVYATKTIIPSHGNITAIEQLLDEVAKPYAGYIEGWGSWGSEGLPQ